jgi:predicted Zn-dependent protease
MTGRKQLTLVSENRMSSLGRSAFASIKREQKINSDPTLNAYVRCVAAAILEVVPEDARPNPDNWEVLVFEDPTPNAFALPGGKIGVHTGMFEVASTPGRLAAVVGHEVAHVLLRHGNERLSQALIADGIASAGTIAVGVKAPRYQELVSLGLGLGAQFGVLLPFSRKHEKEADYIGQLFIAKAGFYPAEAVVLWEAMASHDSEAPPQWQSTHPSDNNRIAYLTAKLPGAMQVFEEARAAGKNPTCTPPVHSSSSVFEARNSSTPSLVATRTASPFSLKR